jgi:hypothetical protein
MKAIGNYEFPETLDEAYGWQAVTSYTAIHMRVLLVARTRVEGSWAAYCVPVPGHNHDEEQHLWRNEGVKLVESLARVAFPQFEDVPYAK